MNLTRKLVGTAALAATLAPASAPAQVGFNLGIPFVPSAVQIVAPRPAYVWEPGYWAWDGHRNFWIDGRWTIAQRSDYRAPPPRWYGYPGYPGHRGYHDHASGRWGDRGRHTGHRH